MGIFDSIKKAFAGSSRLDVSARFELDRHSFNGTMSSFRVAKEIQTGKTVGLKLLDGEKREYFEQRFKGLDKPEEGQIATEMEHPNIVKTLEFGLTTKGIHYILMEYLDGPGLNTLVNEPTREFKKYRLRLIKNMVEAIAYVHSKGYIHRDICPRNFICAKDMKSLKLIDFGLSVPDKPDFRKPGNRTGTPQYMAPEVVRRRPTDHRLDIFSLGVSFYKMLTANHPWDVTDVSGLGALAHDQRKATDIYSHRPNLNKALGQIVMKMLEPKMDDRPKDMAWVARKIKEVRSELQPT